MKKASNSFHVQIAKGKNKQPINQTSIALVLFKNANTTKILLQWQNIRTGKQVRLVAHTKTFQIHLNNVCSHTLRL